MIEDLKKVISQSGASYSEARFETMTTMRLAFSQDGLESVGETVWQGGGVRAIAGGGMAFSSFSNPQDASKAMAEAEKQAAVVGRLSDAPPAELYPVDPVKDDYKPSPKIDPRTISLDEKKELVQDYLSVITKHEEVASVTCNYGETVQKKTFVNSEGSEITQEWLLCKLGGRITTKRGDNVQGCSFAFGYDEDYAKLLNRHDVVEKQLRAGIGLLDAKPIPAGKYRVVCDPDFTGVFTHEAFGHLAESDDTVPNPGIQQEMKLGRQLGLSVLNILDDGSFPGAPGSYAYDDEGVPGGRTYIIKDGILVSRLYSRFTSAALKHLDGDHPPTGNFRWSDFRMNPITRQSNIFIDNGDTPFEEMVAAIDDGYYLCGAKGGQTMGDLFTSGAQYGYEIKNGKIGRMVRDINISGNVFETLADIDAIGDDFRMSEWGGCGKSRAGLYVLQMLDKSGVGGPSIRVNNVVIGGA